MLLKLNALPSLEMVGVRRALMMNLIFKQEKVKSIITGSRSDNLKYLDDHNLGNLGRNVAAGKSLIKSMKMFAV